MISLFQTSSLHLALALSLIMRIENANFIAGPFAMGFKSQKITTVSLIRGKAVLKGSFINPNLEHLGIKSMNISLEGVDFVTKGIDTGKFLFYVNIGKVILETTGLPPI